MHYSSFSWTSVILHMKYASAFRTELTVTPDVAHSAGEGSVVRVAMTMLLFPPPSPTGLKCLDLTMEFI